MNNIQASLSSNPLLKTEVDAPYYENLDESSVIRLKKELEEKERLSEKYCLTIKFILTFMFHVL